MSRPSNTSDQNWSSKVFAIARVSVLTMEYRSNANLAASLAQSVIEKLTTESIRLAHPSLEELQPGNLSKEIVDGIEQAVFPGRYDIREQKVSSFKSLVFEI